MRFRRHKLIIHKGGFRTHLGPILNLAGLFLFLILFIPIGTNHISLSQNYINDKVNDNETNNNSNSISLNNLINPPNFQAEAKNVCISEVHAVGDEWIELFNPNPYTVDLTGWLLMDGDNSTTEADISAIGQLLPYQVVTIGDAAAGPQYVDALTLTDGGDDLILYDGSGNIQDVVIYGSGTGVNSALLSQWYWNSASTATAATASTESIQRIRQPYARLVEDNNLPSDWEVTSSPNNGTISFVPNPMISEIHYSGTDNEWIELYNPMSSEANISGFQIKAFNTYNITILPDSAVIPAHGTLVIGEYPQANVSVSLDFNDSAEVVEIIDTTANISDAIVWGTGNNTFTGELDSWNITYGSNATANVAEGSSLFRYNRTKTSLAETNSSADWYSTDSPTPNSFYQYKSGDILFSEIGYAETEEFIELYNNLTWPVSLDGMRIYDYGGGTNEVLFSGEAVIPAKSLFVVGDSLTYNYTDSITLTNSYEDLVLYGDSTSNLELDVVIYGNDPSNTYPWGPGTGWIGPENATGGLSAGQSIFRKNSSTNQLIDTNTADDWGAGDITPWEFPNYTAPPPEQYSSTLLISEISYSGSATEWIELYNTGDTPINLTGYTIYSLTNNNNTKLPDSALISAKSTLVIGELLSSNISVNFNFDDVGDVVLLRDPNNISIDCLVWGNGSVGFNNVSIWNSTTNATGNLPIGSSLFRYNTTRTALADTNSSADWYSTDSPTPNSFYQYKSGDILFSEIGYAEDYYTEEFIELYNNLTWPVSLDGMRIYDYGGGNNEVEFIGEVIIQPKGLIVVGDNASYDYTDSISLTNDYEDLVLYGDSTTNLELDVVIYGNDASNTYPWGPGTGWIGPENATGGLSAGQSIFRKNSSVNQLIDTNFAGDWGVGAITPWEFPNYQGSESTSNGTETVSSGGNMTSLVLITEIMVDPKSDETDSEYIEIYNTLDVAVDIGGWSVRHSSNIDSADATLPSGTILPAHSYLTFVDNATFCVSEYGVSGLLHEEAISLSNTVGDVLLIDSENYIIDEVAWRSSSENFTAVIDLQAWLDTGIYKGSEGKAIARLYDPSNDNYLDTNSSSDWRYNVYPNPGKHTNTVFFLSSPVVGDAEITTFYSPDNSFAALTGLIDSATASLDICVYQFTSIYIANHIVAAMDRGVKVRLILEDIYPLYDSPYTYDSTHSEVNHEVVYIANLIYNHENGTVKWESPYYFSYTHAKYIVIDNETVVVSTENYKYTGIPSDPSAGNRGWGIAVKNAELAAKYLRVYDFDWSIGKDYNPDVLITPTINDDVIHGNYTVINSSQSFSVQNAKFQTVVGPDETIDVIVDLLNSATKSIYIEVFYMYPTWSGYSNQANNNPFLVALIAAATRGVDVNVILDSTYYVIDGDNNNDEAAAVLESHGVDVHFSRNEDGIEKFHVKAFIVDNQSVMISSLNWNENSAMNNREIGIMVNHTDVAMYYVQLFEFDWNHQSTDYTMNDINTGSNSDEDNQGDLVDQLGGVTPSILGGSDYWKFWLPVIFGIYLATLFSGYKVRKVKEIKRVKKQIEDDKKRAERKYETPQDKKKGSSIIPIQFDFNEVEKQLNTTYGGLLTLYRFKIEENRKPELISLNQEDIDDLDNFVLPYLEYNRSVLPVGKIYNPIDKIIVMRYEPNEYLVIQGKQDLRGRLLEIRNILLGATEEVIVPLSKVSKRVEEIEQNLDLEKIEKEDNTINLENSKEYNKITQSEIEEKTAQTEIVSFSKSRNESNSEPNETGKQENNENTYKLNNQADKEGGGS